MLPPPPPPANRPTPRAARPGWGWYAAWVVLGAVGALTLLATFTPLILLTPVVGLLGLLLCTRPRARAAAPALICGPALPLLFVAWLNRDGPGNICTTTVNRQSCVEEWSPWPWLVAGLWFIAGGVVISVAYRRYLTAVQTRNEAAPAYRIGTPMPPRRETEEREGRTT